MIMRTPSIRELMLMVESYARFDNESFCEVSLPDAEKFLRDAFRSSSMLVSGLFHEDTIHGFIVGSFQKMTFSVGNEVNQCFYYSDLKGFASARAVVVAHERLHEFARSKGAHLLTSRCHPADTEFKLAKILERSGWTRIGGHAFMYDCYHVRNTLKDSFELKTSRTTPDARRRLTA